MTRQIEMLRPAQIRAALAEASVVYLPLGTIEWHCEHLPVGLDSLTAHGLCLKAAEATGGLVYPVLYYGTGGDHGKYPWTVMMDDAVALETLMEKTLTRLQELDVEKVVLFSGHFADEQLAMIDRIAADWASRSGAMKVIATAVNRLEATDYTPDHAGRFESTLLAGFWPETVDLGELAPMKPEDAAMDRHDPRNPIWGVIGTDPRLADVSDGPRLVGEVATRLVAFVNAH